jgi:L-threonylcarbamoyladenylate synthase
MILPTHQPLSSDDSSIATCADGVRQGGMVGLPTETVYGLAADADNATAVARIFEAKGRPTDHPLIVHVAALGDGGQSAVAHYASQVPAFAQALMAAFWPGPLTLILPRRDGVAAAAAGGQNSIGLRCPSHPVAQALLAALRSTPPGQPTVWGLAAPSANRFGRVSPTTAQHVQSELGDDLLILDGGACDVGIESTIIDCSRGAPVLLRPGHITRVQIEQACGRKLATDDGMDADLPAAPRASGTLESHYAPDARVRLMDTQALQAAIDMIAEPLATRPTSAPTIAVYARSPLKNIPPQMVSRRMPDDAAGAAHTLFLALRELDATGVKLIWVEEPPDTLPWDGVRDRLTRAAS